MWRAAGSQRREPEEAQASDGSHTGRGKQRHAAGQARPATERRSADEVEVDVADARDRRFVDAVEVVEVVEVGIDRRVCRLRLRFPVPARQRRYPLLPQPRSVQIPKTDAVLRINQSPTEH